MSDPFSELDKPLPAIKVTCTSTDCSNDEHCYLQKRKVEGAHVFGPCRDCGTAAPFDIARVRRQDLKDIDYTFAALKNEKIRSHYWTLPFDEDALRKAERKGREGVVDGVASRLRSSIGKAAGGFDGRQTGLQGNVVFYAQHATATCCRKCLSYWHGVPAERDLRPQELRYCEDLVKRYLDARLPALDSPD